VLIGAVAKRRRGYRTLGRDHPAQRGAARYQATTPAPSGGEYGCVTNDSVNPARFESSVIPLLRPLYLHAVRMTSSPTDAEDLLQETMLKAYASRHSFNPGTNFNAWLHRIMANTLIDDCRKAKRRPIQQPTDDITDRQLVASAARWQGPLQSAEDRVLEKLPDPYIKAAMLRLPEKYRNTVYLADVVGLSYREIATITGIRPETVGSRLKRGRRQLRHLLTTLPTQD
jgi:RNA polymerase sigma-70 factor, ECF subfamily